MNTFQNNTFKAYKRLQLIDLLEVSRKYMLQLIDLLEVSIKYEFFYVAFYIINFLCSLLHNIEVCVYFKIFILHV